MKWIIRFLWCIPALIVNLLLRFAFEPILNTDLKVWLFQTGYFLLAIWFPCAFLVKLYERSPRVRADRIARLIMAASSSYCQKAGLPDRMIVHLQVWCVYLYAVLPLIRDLSLDQYINKACGDSMFRVYGISSTNAAAREAFHAFQYAFLTHLANVDFDPYGENPISDAFGEFWVEGLTESGDGFELIPLLEEHEHILLYKANLQALQQSIADIF